MFNYPWLHGKFEASLGYFVYENKTKLGLTLSTTTCTWHGCPTPGKKPLCSQAITAGNSMAKPLYSALFDWIVLRVNHALLNKKDMEEAVSVSSQAPSWARINPVFGKSHGD